MNDGYDAAYAQERLDSNQAHQMSALLSEQEIQQQNQFWEDQQNQQQQYYDTAAGGGEEYYYDPNSSQQTYDEYGSATGGVDGAGKLLLVRLLFSEVN